MLKYEWLMLPAQRGQLRVALAFCKSGTIKLPRSGDSLIRRTALEVGR